MATFDSSVPGAIDDDAISQRSTWSSFKVSQFLGGGESQEVRDEVDALSDTLTAHVNDSAIHVTVVGTDTQTPATLPAGYDLGLTVGGGDGSFPTAMGVVLTARSNTARALQFVGAKVTAGLWARTVASDNDWGDWNEVMLAQKHILNSSTIGSDRVWSATQSKGYTDTMVGTRLSTAGGTLSGQLVVPSLRTGDAVLSGAVVDGKRYLDVVAATNNSAGLRVRSSTFNAEMALNAGGANYMLQGASTGDFSLQETVGARTLMSYARGTDTLTLRPNTLISGASIENSSSEVATSQLPGGFKAGFTVSNGGAVAGTTNGWPSEFATIFTARASNTRAFQIAVSKQTAGIWYRSVNDINNWSPVTEIMSVGKHIVNTSATASDQVWSSSQTKSYVDGLSSTRYYYYRRLNLSNGSLSTTSLSTNPRNGVGFSNPGVASNYIQFSFTPVGSIIPFPTVQVLDDNNEPLIIYNIETTTTYIRVFLHTTLGNKLSLSTLVRSLGFIITLDFAT